MQNPTVEQRLAALEKRVSELALVLVNGDRAKDWQSTVGMFTGDEVMKRIEEEGRKWREAERRKAQRRRTKKRRVRV